MAEYECVKNVFIMMYAYCTKIILLMMLLKMVFVGNSKTKQTLWKWLGVRIVRNSLKRAKNF